MEGPIGGEITDAVLCHSIYYARTIAVEALVNSHLDYANCIYVGLLEKDLVRLQRTQIRVMSSPGNPQEIEGSPCRVPSCGTVCRKTLQPVRTVCNSRSS